MSRASKITLAATSLFALSTVGIVHFQQKAERSVSSHLLGAVTSATFPGGR